MMFLVYLLKNGNKSYIGYTNDFFRRWKQHNCILSGGAKYTTRNKGSNIDSLNLKIYTKKEYYEYFDNLELKELYW